MLCSTAHTALCAAAGLTDGRFVEVQGDIILVGLRDYQDEKADVILKYVAHSAAFCSY